VNVQVRTENTMIEAIRQRIEKSLNGAIPFKEYMEQCLYHPEYGYYMRENDKIGRGGDFYTSSGIGGLFGEVLAHYVAEQARMWSPGSSFTVTEWGGGTGQLARQLLDELQSSHLDVYERLAFIAVEASPRHRTLQAGSLAPHADRIRWITEREWLAAGLWEDTLIYSNELMDAFPVHRVKIHNGQLSEIYVERDESGGGFAEKLVPLQDGPLRDYMGGLGLELLEGQQLEVNLEAAAWIRRIGAAIRHGQIVTIDYGDRAEELAAPHRMRGTLMCYRRHLAEDNPYAEPGGQDITSHVNFSDLIRAGQAVGLEAAAYITQKQFLVDNGLLQKLQDTDSPDPFSPVARRNRAIRQLLLSDQMSELFKVLIQKKGERP
jgi:SAM-dependent MidA family methyltransferase